MFIYSLYLHTSMHTFLVLLPTVHFAANRVEDLKCSSASWQLCIYCMTAAVCAWQLLHVHCIWFVCITATVCALCMTGDTDTYARQMVQYMHMAIDTWMCHMLYVHDRCWLCRSDDVCAWPLLAVHEWCCICMTYDTCAVQLMNVHCTWPLRFVHYRWCAYDSYCLYMTEW